MPDPKAWADLMCPPELIIRMGLSLNQVRWLRRAQKLDMELPKKSIAGFRDAVGCGVDIDIPISL